MHKLTGQQLYLKLLPTEKLTNGFDSTTKLAKIGMLQGTGPEVLNKCKCVGNTDVVYFGFYFMSPKWTRNKIVIEITPLLQAYFLYHLYR